jgi:Fe-S oxidoreductase
VLIESNFPAEAGVMLRNLENKGNPWGAAPSTRDDWTRNLGFEVPRVGEVDDFEYLFWVGCAGAFEDRAKKTTRAVATLLHEAGVSFAILGEGETCTGDPARRIGNEFVFQMLAQQNVETLNEAGAKKIVATCPHCFNTLANEYGQLGGDFEVVHHTQLLAHLVEAGTLTPVQPVDGGVTYHDPCYLGRHNRVFEPPREVLAAAVDGAGVDEMERFKERSFCCGAGGARMWMEERIGKRINVERVEEALATGAQTVAVGCPFCLTMLGDGVTGKKSVGEASTDVEVVDVATVLLRSLKPE